MIMKERLPPLRWRASSPGHILGRARLADLDAELEQLTMDPRRSPQFWPRAWRHSELLWAGRSSAENVKQAHRVEGDQDHDDFASLAMAMRRPDEPMQNGRPDSQPCT